MHFHQFDPLSVAPSDAHDEAAITRRQKRNIRNILNSYVGWYDPFAELIQNALDAVDKRQSLSNSDYKKRIHIIIDASDDSITVSDNGIGLDEASFKQFLAPNESFKDLDSRGSKGVGATYLAYANNFIRIDTKTKNFAASGEMEHANNWLYDDSAPGNPLVFPSTSDPDDLVFNEFDRGVSIKIRFDNKNLSWHGLNNAEAWFHALSMKTALGPVNVPSDTHVKITHFKKDGGETVHEIASIEYVGPRTHFTRSKEYDYVIEQVQKRIEKHGASAGLPANVKNLECV